MPGSALTLVPPSGKETLKLTANDHVTADMTGIYVASIPKGQVEEKTFLAVNIDPRESELLSENMSSLRAIFATNPNPDQNLAVHAPGELTDEQKATATDWRFYLLGALFCLFLEVGLRDFWIK